MEIKKSEAKSGAVKKPAGRKPRDSECGLKLYYQPIVQPMFAKTIGFEALIRLIDKEMRFLSPAIFIPIAEKSSLNSAIGNWVFEETCRTINKLDKKQVSFEYISVNVSTKHFLKKDFISSVKKILDDNGVEPNKLCLEISELAMINKNKGSLKKMHDLQKLGFKIAIDDFGSGFSALSKMGSLPADILKLDKSFVDRIVIDPKAFDITEAIINLANKLHLEVVAKGVEDSAQMKLLMSMGCNKMQGYLFGAPMKEHDILYPKKKAGDSEDN